MSMLSLGEDVRPPGCDHTSDWETGSPAQVGLQMSVPPTRLAAASEMPSQNPCQTLSREKHGVNFLLDNGEAFPFGQVLTPAAKSTPKPMPTPALLLGNQTHQL